MYVTLEPAYGRDYKTAKEARAAFFSKKDFIISTISHPGFGQYFNFDDSRTLSESGNRYTIRFCGKRKTVNV